MQVPTTLTLPLLADLPTTLPAPPVYPASFFHVSLAANPPTKLTLVVEKAIEFVESNLPKWAVNHCYRVYAYGLALAEYAGWTKCADWDQEVWFLAALLHDIGWAHNSECCSDNLESGKDDNNQGSILSFEIWGGIKAREMLLEWGAPKRCADEACEAIIRHTADERPPGRVRLVTALLQLGPSHDFRAVLHGSVLDTGRVFIDPKTTANITELYPRLELIYHFEDTMKRELKRKPGCMSELWAPRVIGQVGGIQDFEGIQGSKKDVAVAGEGEKWLALKS